MALDNKLEILFIFLLTEYLDNKDDERTGIICDVRDVISDGYRITRKRDSALLA